MTEVDAVRAFNRFYTRRIGALGEHLLDSPYSLTEMRVLYELAHRRQPTACEVGGDLGLDAGYLSRMLARFEARRLIAREPAPADGRRALLQLTRNGRAFFGPYERRARRAVASMLGRLPRNARRRLVRAMETIERTLDGSAEPRRPTDRLRSHTPGDLGWIVQRHGALYAREWGYDATFEAVVARIAAEFLERFDPARERCWIAERDGDRVGSVCLVKKSATIAKLRLLLVEPDARGSGLGRRLVEACIQFAREAGYRKITLWTHSQLTAARHIYAACGFRCLHQQKVHQFGQRLVDETWERTC